MFKLDFIVFFPKYNKIFKKEMVLYGRVSLI